MSPDAKTKDSYDIWKLLKIIRIIFLMFGNQLVTVVYSNYNSGASFGYNSTTNATHVLTYSSPSSNSNRHNSKLVFGTFDSNGTLSKSIILQFFHPVTPYKRKLKLPCHIPEVALFMFMRVVDIPIRLRNHNVQARDGMRNVHKSVSLGIFRAMQCVPIRNRSYQSGWGLVGNNETVTHIGQRNSLQINYNQGYANESKVG